MYIFCVILKGKMKRIIHTFTLRARKLRDVFIVPGDAIGWKSENFFGNSLDRNGKRQREDVDEHAIAFGTGKSELSELED